MGATDGVTPLNAANVLHKASDDTHTGVLTNNGNIIINSANLILQGSTSGAQYLNPLGQPSVYGKFIFPYMIWQFAINISSGVYRLPAKVTYFSTNGILIPEAYITNFTIVESAQWKDNVGTAYAVDIYQGSNCIGVYIEYNVTTTQGTTAYHDASVSGYVLIY